MTSCQRLQRDHEAIMQVSLALESVLGLEARKGNVPPTLFAGAIEFFSALVERCHEAMEERVFFPLLAELGTLDGAALRTIEGEHEEGRQLLKALRPLCVRPGNQARVSALLGAYLARGRRHVELEGASLLPRAEQALSPSRDAEVQAEFDRIEQAVLGPGGRDALLALGGAITRTCRVLTEEDACGGRQLTVLDLLHTPQETVGPEDNLSRAAELMELFGARELAVVERGALVGILTRTDLEPHRGHLEWTRVRAAMTPDPVTVAPDCSIATVAGLLLDCGFNSVAVATNGHLFGVLRRSDLLRVLRDEARSTPKGASSAS
jgi:CBS domain-containing protein